MAGYQDALLSGFASGIAGHGVSGVRRGRGIDVPETAAAPAHSVVALSRVFGDRVEPSSFVLTVGFGARPLGVSGPGCLARFELMSWVDDVDLPGLLPPHVLAALSTIGRMIHGAAKPGAPPWQLGHTLTLPDEGLAGWNRFLLARSLRPIETELGLVDVVRVLPIHDAEAAELRATEDMMGGWSFVTGCENRDPAGTLARWRNPPGGPAPVVAATRVEFEPAGDTLRVHVAGAPWSTSAMRDVAIGLDAEGHLLALELIDREGPRALIELGPRALVARRDYARVLQMDAGALLVTMAEKRIRGHERHPHVPWSRHGERPA